MQFVVDMLRCRDGSYYTGHTDDLEKRMAEHEQGLGCDWTRRRRPVKLVWCDSTSSRYEALEFERRVKNWSRAKKEALIAGDWAKVGHFARPPHERPSTSLGTNEGGEGLGGPSTLRLRSGEPSLGTNEAGSSPGGPANAVGTNESELSTR